MPGLYGPIGFDARGEYGFQRSGLRDKDAGKEWQREGQRNLIDIVVYVIS